MCVCFAWLFDADGDLALIDPKKPVLEREREREQEGRIWSRSEGRLQREPKPDIQDSSSSFKPVTPITILKPSSIEETPLLQHHNPILDLQDNLSHKKPDAPNTMAEEGEHPNIEEPMNNQELLNTIVASQIQLREDINRAVQQFQILKTNQEENQADHNPPTMESGKKINERMNKIEECKVVGCASGVGLLPTALGPSFLDKGVGTGLATT